MFVSVITKLCLQLEMSVDKYWVCLRVTVRQYCQYEVCLWVCLGVTVHRKCQYRQYEVCLRVYLGVTVRQKCQ